MSVILAIDAAWTEREPSGVAVLVSSDKLWRCAALAPSYQSFFDLAKGIPVDWNAHRFSGSIPNANLLLDSASRLASAPTDLVTIDMPVAVEPIYQRRVADNLISKKFGRNDCSTHSPNPLRPGRFGESLSQQFRAAGYKIATKSETPGTIKRLVEVYPHPALLTLLNRDKRVRYKVAKSNRYWENSPVRDRIGFLLNEFQAIVEAINSTVESVDIPLPQAENVISLKSLKRYEDAIDALICGWVGMCYLKGNAVAFGDETAAIWCPYKGILEPS